MSWNSVEQIFLEKGVVKGNALYLASQDAISFIKECEKSNMRILGFEGFVVGSDFILPLTNAVADFSNSQDSGIYEDAIRLLNKITSETTIPANARLMFEIVSE